MQLLIIRHAIAVERDAFERTGKPDEQRPLTDAGRRKMKKIAVGLRRLATAPDILASSPLTRAAQTARIVAEAYGISAIETVDALTPEAARPSFIKWLGTHPNAGSIAVVGHEPHLSDLIAWLIAGVEADITLKKGGAALLTFEGKPARKGARLEWLLTGGQLADVGG